MMGPASEGGAKGVAHYILLMTLTSEGREKMLDDPESMVRAANRTSIPGVSGLGLYAVLGPYDFVSIVEAPDNDAAARYSMELGVKTGVHITTLPAVPIALLKGKSGELDPALTTGAEAGPGSSGDPVS